jgi:hypothetical protein
MEREPDGGPKPWATASFHGGEPRRQIRGRVQRGDEGTQRRSCRVVDPIGGFPSRERIAELATKNRLPAIYAQGSFVVNGGLMSYGADRTERYKRIAVFIDKILKGAKPADLPVEQPTKFEFIINLKAAKQIGLTIPPNVLARADKVIR